MADDIDIEEHDLLDNPQIKNIFPHITNIKSEAIEFEEDNEYQEYLDDNIVIKTEPVEYNTRPNMNSNVIIFGSKPSTTTSTSTNKDFLINRMHFETDDDDDDEPYESEVESASSDEDPCTIPCSVVLTNWHSLLENNSCYCSECQILFPTRNAIESHRMTAHSFLVAVSRNKAVKSTTKSSLKLKTPDLLCQHCNIYFETDSDLILHKKSLVPHTERWSTDETSLQASKGEELYVTCSLCSCVFKHEHYFKGHVYLNHGMQYLEKVLAPYNPYCKFCKICVKSPKKFNCHMSLNHSEIYLQRNNYKRVGQYECHLCERTFPSGEDEVRHRNREHSTSVNDCEPKLRKFIMDKSMSNTKSLELCNYKYAPKKKNAINKKPLNKMMAGIDMDENILVSKNHLYKCRKCRIHFVSALTALEHMNHCTLRKGDWKCGRCRRCFKIEDRLMHIHQHTINRLFKVFIISEEILARVVHRCETCNVCFDNSTFSKYHSSGCRSGPSIECEICELRVHKFAFPNHLKSHTELGMKINDFIITDYCKIPKRNTVSQSKLINRSSNVTSLERFSNSGAKKLDKFQINYSNIYFCPNCKTYMNRNRICDGHEKGECLWRRTGRELCKLCGLVFTKKGYTTHQAYHKMMNIKLHNLTFINIINGKKMVPPFPEFMLCSRCQVYFVSPVALRNHACNAKEHKSCQFCNTKFSDLALKLHLPFHRFTNSAVPGQKKAIVSKKLQPIVGQRPKKSLASVKVKNTVTETETRISTPIHDLIKKYESLETVWNILYRCQTCDIVFDSYDGTVEHCQDHYCNMENYNVNIKYCEECDLKFVDKYYSKHAQLHLQNSVGRDSFVIIECDYSSLLSDSWLRIFDKVSKDQLQQIMSKSIYNVIRGVRMELLSDGDLGAVYKCRLCGGAVDVPFVVDHVRDRECVADVLKFSCDVCDIRFANKNTANAHMHKHRLIEMPFKIVSFNDPKNLFIDEALIKSAKTDDLKFVRCHHCGKLINKSMYRIHLYKHNYRKKKQLLKSQPIKAQNSVTPKVKGKGAQILPSKTDQKSLFRFYVCTNCNVALLQHNAHICRHDIQKKKCHKCQILISKSPSSVCRHNGLHKAHPTLSHKTIKLTYFSPKEKLSVGGTNKGKIQTPYHSTMHADRRKRDLQKLKYYKCVNCSKCITSKNYRGHKACERNKLVECKICFVKVDSRSYNSHKRLHNKISFTATDLTITMFDNKNNFFLQKPSRPAEAVGTSVSGKGTNKTTTIAGLEKHDSIRVYKCKTCQLLFVCRLNLLEHISKSQSRCGGDKGEKCDYCSLTFHSSDIKHHKLVQNCRTRVVSTINVSTLLLKTSDPAYDTNWLSYCTQCDFYTLNAMKRHFVYRHRSANKKTPCEKCGVQFASASIRKHNLFHHGSVEIPFSDLNVEVIEDVSLERAGYEARTPNDSSSTRISLEENVTDTLEGNLADKMEIDDTVQNRVMDIFKCATCDNHFLHKKNLQIHQVKGDHRRAQVTCPLCGLGFSKFSYARHPSMHKSNVTFNVIELDTLDKRSSSNDRSNRSLTDTLDSIEMTSDSVSLDESITSNSKTRASTRQRSTRGSTVAGADRVTLQAADSCGPSSDEARPTDHVSRAKTSAEVKLFKCGECDVYFLDAESCYDHTVHHSPLDPTEYIACKICDLQFLNRSLDGHMKGHREKTFNMDTLVVDEYQPHSGGVRVDTYSANDRLKSKLVSTTTYSDND